MWRDWTNWARVLIVFGGVVLFYAMMAVLGLVAEGPVKTFGNFIGGLHPVLGGAILLAIFLGLAFSARAAGRRDERRQIAETGVIDVPAPVDHRRQARGYFLWTSPLWLAVGILFLLAVASNFTNWRPW